MPETAEFYSPKIAIQPSLFTDLGIAQDADDNLTHAVASGVHYTVFERLQQRLEISQLDLGQLLSLPLTTLKRRAQQGSFTALEGDRLVRIATVLEWCETLFEGNHEAALQWLKSPARALGGVTPLSHIKSETGAREVLDLIGRLEHGVVT